MPLVLTPSLRLVPAPDVFYTEIGDEAVVLNQVTGRYHGLDSVGTRIWSLLVVERRSLGETHAMLLREYEVTPDALWQDLTEFLNKVDELELTTIQPPDVP